MLKKAVIKHFKSAANTARALGISRAAVHNWPDKVPEASAYKIQVVTGGALKVDPSAYPPSRTAQIESATAA